jgi:hypothetical protein
MKLRNDLRHVAFRVGLAIVGLSLVISGLFQSLRGTADYGVGLWPPIVVIAGSVAVLAALIHRTGLALFATGLIACLGVYARTAGDGTLLIVAIGLIGLLMWSRGRRAGIRLALSAIGFAASLGSGALGLFLLYGAFLAGDLASPWLASAVTALALAVIGLWAASRDFRRASRAAKQLDTPA